MPHPAYLCQNTKLGVGKPLSFGTMRHTGKENASKDIMPYPAYLCQNTGLGVGKPLAFGPMRHTGNESARMPS